MERSLLFSLLLFIAMTCAHRLIFSLAFCIVIATPWPTEVDAGEMMPANLASRLGLEQAWQRQLQVPAGASSIADQQIHVHQSKPHEYVEVVSPQKRKNAETGKEETFTKVLLRIDTERVDRNGTPIGKKEAERLAGNEIRRLTHRGIDAKIESRTVPRINLYTISDDGTVECRDAEDGRPVWMKRIGNRNLGYSKLGIDDRFVTVINGGNLIKLDATDGTELESVSTSSTPLFGAIHAGDFSIIPTIRNGMDGYPLADPTRVPFSETVQGLALSPPRKSPTSTRLAWGTNRGFVYVMESEGTPSVLFRLNTDGIVSGRIAAAKDDHFFFASESGQVYGILATRTGKVLWSRPYGEPFYNAPLVVDKQLLLRSTYGNLYSLNTDDGMMTWTYTVPNVDELLGAFDGKIYMRLLSGGLAVIELKTGKMISQTSEVVPTRLLTNRLTNRLYLIGKTGAVQCLRPEGEILPTFNPATDSNGAPSSTDPTAAEEEPAGPTAAFSSQGKAKDPFGATPDPAPGTDPFGAGAADPFGGGGDAMADPFGAGGADPFGAGDGAMPDPFGN